MPFFECPNCGIDSIDVRTFCQACGFDESEEETVRELEEGFKDDARELDEKAVNIIVTTSMFVANREIDYEIDLLAEECAYGMNIFRDMFAAVRDIIGGRSKASEKVLKDGKREALTGLRFQAANLGADAIIAADLKYQELSGGGKSGILLVVATGTAVKLKPLAENRSKTSVEEAYASS